MSLRRVSQLVLSENKFSRFLSHVLKKAISELAFTYKELHINIGNSCTIINNGVFLISSPINKPIQSDYFTKDSTINYR